MQVRFRSYPHPVLSHFSDDLVNCSFQQNLKIDVTANSYNFHVTAKTSSADLVKLISDGKAYYAVHAECASTRYRQMFSYHDDKFDFQIPANFLDGRVQLCSFIVAGVDLPKYQNKNFHPDYGNRTFPVKKGDVLAVDRDRSFFAEKETDSLKKIHSIFIVTKNNVDDPPAIDLDLLGERVVIKLSPENFKKYGNLQLCMELQTTLANMLAYPALISSLEYIRTTAPADYEERQWYRVLRKKLSELGVNPDNPESFEESIVLAQKVIGDPLTSSLAALEADFGGSED